MTYPLDATSRRAIILLVDDEPRILSTIANRLHRAFPELGIVTASGGAAAMRVLDEQNVDLIMTDQRMPGIDGVTLLAYARQHHPDVPRVVLTGHADVDVVVSAINSGAVHAYFLKPAISEDLERTLAKLLDDRFAKLHHAGAFMRAFEITHPVQPGVHVPFRGELL